MQVRRNFIAKPNNWAGFCFAFPLRTMQTSELQSVRLTKGALGVTGKGQNTF